MFVDDLLNTFIGNLTELMITTVYQTDYFDILTS